MLTNNTAHHLMVRQAMIPRKLKVFPYVCGNRMLSGYKPKSNIKDSYKILELEEGCSLDDIRNSYRSLAKKYHPDSSSATADSEAFMKVEEAYRVVLSDVATKKKSKENNEEEEDQFKPKQSGKAEIALPLFHHSPGSRHSARTAPAPAPSESTPETRAARPKQSGKAAKQPPAGGRAALGSRAAGRAGRTWRSGARSRRQCPLPRGMRLCERKPLPARRRCAALLGSLLLAAAVALRGTARPCPDARPEAAARPRCRQRLYQALELSPSRRINCSGIVRGDEKAIQEARLSNLEAANKRVSLTPGEYLNMTKDCSKFKETRRFIEFPLSQEEADFPIAYSMVIHDKIEMFERLLRSLYAPQNVYCVHIDNKSPAAFQEAVRAIAACFPNVFVASRLENVVYASWSRLQADLNCMQDLLQSPVPWQYILNTCGTDFPIKTNAEIVRSLKVLQGQNSMESEKPSAAKQQRWRYHHKVGKFISRTTTEKPPPPHNSPMFTGSAYIVVTRAFVQHVFENPTVQQFLEWAKDTYSPDEHVWATLNRMPGVPGAMPQSDKFQLSDMNALPRLVKWQYMEGDTSKGAPYPPCTGQHQRAVCIYGAGDVPWMLQQHHLLANKFDPLVDDAAIQCLEEYLRHRALYGRGL